MYCVMGVSEAIHPFYRERCRNPASTRPVVRRANTPSGMYGTARAQGHRILFPLGEDGEQVVVVPAAAEAFGFDAVLVGPLAFEQVQGDSAEA